MLICLSCSHIKLCVKNCLSVIIFPFFVPLAAMNISQPGVPAYSPCGLKWLRRRDSNPRPSAYEADELTTATTPHCIWCSWLDSNLHFTVFKTASSTCWDTGAIGDPRGIRTHISRIKSPVSYQLDERIIWSSQSDLNRQSTAYKAGALPLCYRSILVIPVRFELTSPGLRGRCPTS